MKVLEKILEEIEEMRNIMESTVAIDCFGKDCEHDDCTICVCERAMEIVCSHMDEMNDDWIPCSERLPEKNVKELYDMQLVTLKDGEVCLGVYRNEDDEWWTRKQEGERVYTNTHEVIAWKPLPEPYRAADKQDWKENMLNTFLAGH